jgi:threonylcarbamoyladenosine tRNA methylthiotransferase MtaB
VASFYVENFGCRATQADGAAIEQQFMERGLERAAAPRKAQIVVLNTCTVTSAADQDARSAIRRIHRENPECRIVVTGCYAQRAPDEIAALPGVSKVIGNSHKHQLAGIAVDDLAEGDRRESFTGGQASLSSVAPGTGSSAFIPLAALDTAKRELESGSRIFVSDIFAHTELMAAPVFEAAHQRTRPNLKVQDGCDNRCSFCIIPSVRGHSRSLPAEEVIREVNGLVASGYREVVISGINLGRWGQDLAGRSGVTTKLRQRAEYPSEFNHRNPRTFPGLVRLIIENTALEKLRISSVEPMDWSEELISLVCGSPRIAKHAHVPLQSGSDRVLRKMHRKYRPWHYRQKIEQIRAAIPGAAIGADVMVGFPGEAEADFEATRRMIEDLPLTYLHVFTYSLRPGTPAASMPAQVPVRVARERNQVLRELGAEKKLAFMRSFAGKTIEAITLHACDGESTEALSDNYLKMRLAGRHEANRWVKAHVDGVADGALVGCVTQVRAGSAG